VVFARALWEPGLLTVSVLSFRPAPGLGRAGHPAHAPFAACRPGADRVAAVPNCPVRQLAAQSSAAVRDRPRVRRRMVSDRALASRRPVPAHAEVAPIRSPAGRRRYAPDRDQGFALEPWSSR